MNNKIYIVENWDCYNRSTAIVTTIKKDAIVKIKELENNIENNSEEFLTCYIWENWKELDGNLHFIKEN